MATKKNINASWNFTKDAVSVAEGTSVLSQGNWETLDLPHTWNGDDGQDGGNDYYRGTCYYAKSMKRDEFGSDPIVYMEFEGANSSAWLYVNGKEAGHHDGGYSTWRVNVTDLLAEDNELNMEIAEFVLQNEGAEVTKAWNGQETVELFRNSEPGEFDVILMDIMMPIMDGYEAAKMIRSLDREDAKEVPIIAMTANAFTEDRIRAKEAGMDEHVAKPVDVELLVKVIHKLVG